MKLGFIGLGRMGKAMVLRLLEQGVDVVAYNRTGEKTKELVYDVSRIKYQVSGIKKKNIRNTKYVIRNTGILTASYTIKEFVDKLEKLRVIWLMVPHGPPVDEMIEKLLNSGVKVGDLIIDGGNSFYKDSIRRYEFLKKKGIHYLDIGTSGGLEGARNGACMMVGGDEKVYKIVEPMLKLAATKDGVAYFGPAGSGHFVKMVHNGVEYGMLQAIGEGFEILSKGMPVREPFARAAHGRLDLHKVAFNWTRGSVIRGWLMELLERALKSDPRLERIQGVVGGGETGGWTVKVANELKVETPVIENSLSARKKSLAKPTFSGKVIAALRREFGGHAVQIK